MHETTLLNRLSHLGKTIIIELFDIKGDKSREYSAWN